MTRILLTGADGQVGWELRRSLPTIGEVIACNHSQLDVASPDNIRRVVREHSPNIIVNAGAYTAVDRAETEPELAMAINGVAPGILAEEAKKLGALLVHYSTDYVFDGMSRTPYREDDPVDPLNVYGRTKLAGERAIQQVNGAFLIFRTAWVYASRGKNFLVTILRLAEERNELRIVNDQIGSPTWCRVIAEGTSEVLEQLQPRHTPSTWAEPIRGREGIYNLTCSGRATWYEFAQEILRLLTPRNNPKIIPISTAEFRTPAMRPAFSVLSSERLDQTFGLKPPVWHAALRTACEELRRAPAAEFLSR